MEMSEEQNKVRRQRNLRYEAKRWVIVHQTNSPVELFAISELQRALQSFLPYVIEVRSDWSEAVFGGNHIVLVGTVSSNSFIADLGGRGVIVQPTEPEGYHITCKPSPWNEDGKLLVIAGTDSNGVLYGVEDLNARVFASLVAPETDTNDRRYRALGNIQDFEFGDFPRIQNRGIWSWGYVIYDYRRFFDQMARLRFNIITIWNDCIPTNCREVIDYAKSRGLKVVLGFPWGWGYDFDISDAKDRESIKEMVLEEYNRCYRDLPIDGLYLQTDTEHAATERNGKTIAAWACELVTDVTNDLRKVSPDLWVQFGLHATSIQENYTDLESLDPSVTIVWEDAGVIPYAYEPIISWTESKTEPLDKDVAFWGEQSVGDLERTIEYSKRLASLADGGFAMVPKGWIAINWPDEFEHHESFILGERGVRFIENRLKERQPRWDAMNAMWFERFPLALRFYREIVAASPKSITITGLIEDGMFELTIQPSVAIFAQSLWNPFREDSEILRLALSPYYSRGF